jgi:hypothetical protein
MTDMPFYADHEAGSAHNFDAGRLNVFQSLLHRPCGGPACLPPTHEDWYARSALK